jgi:hypothetical protein
MRRHMLILAVFFGLLMAAAGPAEAQFTSSLGGTFNNPGSALIGTMIGNRILADAARKGSSPGGAASPERPSPSKPSASVPAPRLTFTPVAGNLMVKELADTLVADAASRQKLSEAFAGYLRDFDDQARRDREPSHDVGRAAAFFVMVNYFAATGREPTDAQADGAQATFRAGLVDNAGFARIGDRERQRLYESLVILGSFPLAGVVQAQQEKDLAKEKTFREFAAELVKTLIGVPVEKIRLTKAGFRIDQ